VRVIKETHLFATTCNFFVFYLFWGLYSYLQVHNVYHRFYMQKYILFSNFQAAAHLPYEFTVIGMLERLNAYIEYQVCIESLISKFLKSL